METKYKMSELGLGLNQKWNTDNTLATELSVEDQVCEASQRFLIQLLNQIITGAGWYQWCKIVSLLNSWQRA